MTDPTLAKSLAIAGFSGLKHLDRYLDEFEFRFNNRDNPYLFRDTLMRLLKTSNLEYKNLTKDKAA